jgi:hypothetical protein
MEHFGMRRPHPQLKELVAEASRALAQLDAARLEELALSCRALNRDLATVTPEDRAQFAREARAASGEMAVFARVLDATRSNLNVLNRLGELRAGSLDYGQSGNQSGWPPAENRHGDN